MSDIAVSLMLNGQTHELAVAPNLMLADLLRDHFGLTGCKVGCDGGVCGACTVLLDDRPVAACTTFAFVADRRSVTTVEVLGRGDDLHPVQAAFLEAGAFQCGFCTSGMILSIVALLRQEPNPDEATIRDWLGGNICRCTGYRQIADVVRHATRGAVRETAS